MQAITTVTETETKIKTLADLIEVWADEIDHAHADGELEWAIDLYYAAWYAVVEVDEMHTEILCTAIHERVGDVAFKVLDEAIYKRSKRRIRPQRGILTRGVA